MIDITGVDLVQFAKEVYALSKPQGMGFLHAKPGGLSDEEAESRISDEGRIAISMDYVNGRACKMTVFRDGNGRLTIQDSWFDHTDDQLNRLLQKFGISTSGHSSHGISCECSDCRTTRRGH